jgi:hypothetical protein
VAVEHVATVYLARRGVEAPPTDSQDDIGLFQFDWLTMRLPVEGARSNDLLELAGAQCLVMGTGLFRHRQGSRNLTRH